MFTFLCSLEVMGARGDVKVTRKLLSSTTSYEDSGAHTDVILQQSRDFTEENRTSLVHVFVYKKPATAFDVKYSHQISYL